VARRDDRRVARRLYRKQVIDGVYRLNKEALLDGFFHFLEEEEVYVFGGIMFPQLFKRLPPLLVQRTGLPCMASL
jgi:hypothetical protein